MSAILDKLLKGQKVEWKTLGEICKKIYSGGTPNTSKPEYWENGTIPWMSSGEVNLGIIYQTEKFITELGLKNSSAKFVPKNSIVIALAGQGKTRGKVARIKIDLTTNQSLASLTFDEKLVNSDYVYHFLESQYENLRQISSGNGNRGGLNLQMISSYQIPIPPLDVQAEIVRILDAFTAVTAELTAELNMREKQYQYYRDKLLSFSEAGIETDSNRQQQTALCEGLANNVKQNHQIIWKSLGEVAEYSKSRISFDKLNEKNYIGVDNLLQNRMGKTNSSYLPTSGNLTAYFENDILIGNIRPYLKKIWQANQIGGTNGDVLVIHLKDKNILPRYLYQILADDKFFDFNMQNAKGAKMPRGNKEAILKYSFPVPPLDEQKRIVNILDKFEALTHSITEGLPKEIALRQQQYEYYREQLLDFPRN